MYENIEDLYFYGDQLGNSVSDLEFDWHLLNKVEGTYLTENLEQICMELIKIGQ